MSDIFSQKHDLTQIMPALAIRFDKHLFITGDSNDVNGQHAGAVTLSPTQQEDWLNIIAYRRMIADKFGAKFAFLLAPDKQTVYRHIMPDTYRFRLAEFLSESTDVVDVAPALSSLAHLTDVYPFTDSHWDHRGASLAAALLLVKFGLSYPANLSKWTADETPGDLGNKVDPAETSKRHLAVFSGPSQLIFDNNVPNNGRVRIYAKPLSSDKQSGSERLALVFGDSFSYDLVHFLKEAFDIVVQVHCFSFDIELVERLRPDFVIGEITERFVYRLPVPTDGRPLRFHWISKILLGEKAPTSRRIVPGQPDELSPRAKTVLGCIRELYAPYEKYLAEHLRDEHWPHFSFRDFPVSEILEDESIGSYINFRVGFLKGLRSHLSPDEQEAFASIYDVDRGVIRATP